MWALALEFAQVMRLSNYTVKEAMACALPFRQIRERRALSSGEQQVCIETRSDELACCLLNFIFIATGC